MKCKNNISSSKKAPKTAKISLSGFESLHAHSKSRSCSGFSLLQIQPGQKAGQNISISMLPYKLAKVYNGDKDWFVHYSYWSLRLREYVRVKVRLKQRGLDKDTRHNLLEDLRADLNGELRERNRRKEYEKELSPQAKKFLKHSLVECLRMMALHDDIAVSRAATYLGLASKLEAFYVASPLFTDAMPLDLDERFIEQYRNYLQREKYVGKTINKHLWALQAIAEDMGLTISTEKYRVKQLKNETGKYPPLTHEEKEKAFSYFRNIKPGLHMLHLHQYYTCIRPAELHRLQVKFFDLKRETVYLDWLDTKNGLSAHVQLLPPLVRALKQYGIQNLPGDWYLFGKNCEPSPEQYEGDWAGATWTAHRVRMDMPKEKQSYGLKHTFNRDYVENNKGKIDWEFLRRHNRHATIQQTQQYISELTAYFIDANAVILDYTQ